MKNKNKFFTVLLMLSFTSILAFAFNKHYASASDNIVFKLTSMKSSYKLGEIIQLEATVTNNSSEPIYLLEDPREFLGIQISSKENTGYKTYVGKGRDYTLDGVISPIKVDPKDTVRKQTTVLWNKNLVPEVKNLSSQAAESYIGGKILTDYAFPKAGTYFIKGAINLTEDAINPTMKIESEPIKITIEEPVGEDLEVWNKIKDNDDFAYFIQEGDIRIPFYKEKEREKFLNKVEQITNQYPNSFYAKSLQQSLTKFRADEAKRQEAMEKLKQKQSQ